MKWFAIMCASSLLLVACGKSDGGNAAAPRPVPGPPAPTAGGGGDGGGANGGGAIHGHAEVPIGSVTIGDMVIECAQDHGLVEAGKNMHLVVKLPYNDGGDTIVRAWIGTDDRNRSRVAKGDYAAAHDDYDVHVDAPDPLPAGAAWWVEVEKPDGTTGAGSVPILVE